MTYNLSAKHHSAKTKKNPSTPTGIVNCMSALGLGTAEIHSNLTVSDCNQFASHYLSQSTTLYLNGATLQCHQSADLNRLKQAVYTTCNTRKASIIKLREHAADELILICHPHDADLEIGLASDSCSLFIKPSLASQLRLARKELSDQYGITHAENEILALMLRGANTQEMAVSRRTSSETVRSQIKNLCAKTGSRGQLGLIAFAARVTAAPYAGATM